MGSQWAPVMCLLVALHWEHTYSILFGQAIFLGKLFSAFRFVENRLLVGQKRRIDTLTFNLLLEFTPLYISHPLGGSAVF